KTTATARGPTHSAALANITSTDGRCRLTRGPGARQGEAAASDQMPTRWSDVAPAVLQDLAISSLRCPQRPCPRQNLGQPGLLANVDGYQDGGGKVPRQIPHAADQG